MIRNGETGNVWYGLQADIANSTFSGEGGLNTRRVPHSRN